MPARRSAGPPDGHIDYFVPRSVSEFNLTGVGDIALPPTQKWSSPAMLSHTRSTGTIMIPIQQQKQQQVQHHQVIKAREKMVTFEDDPKCPHGMPTTPLKAGQISVNIT